MDNTAKENVLKKSRGYLGFSSDHFAMERQVETDVFLIFGDPHTDRFVNDPGNEIGHTEGKGGCHACIEDLDAEQISVSFKDPGARVCDTGQTSGPGSQIFYNGLIVCINIYIMTLISMSHAIIQKSPVKQTDRSVLPRFLLSAEGCF